MLRKILFQAHWLVGITLGLVLAMSGVTGGLMAFDKEISRFALGAYQQIDRPSASMLSAAELYQSVHAANPERIVLALTPASAGQAAQVEFAAKDARGGAIGNGDTRNEIRLVDPFSGVLLPESAFAAGVQDFMAWLREIHQGHWLPPGDAIGTIIYQSVGIGAVFLFVMALSGLYMRWPRGRAAWSWRSWFKIHTQLKGRAFLFNLHSVLGTVVLLAYLVSAHSGAFQNGTVSWYGNAVRTLVGAPLAVLPGGGMGAGPGGGMGGGPPPGSGGAAPMPQGPPGGGGMGAQLDVSPLWAAFTAEVPTFRTASMQVTRAPDQAARFTYTTASDAIGVVDVDAPAAGIKHMHPGEVVPLTFAEWVVQKNQDIHEGRILGKPGVLIMMLASLSMPVFFVTGWMMYLKRRKQKSRAQAPVRQQA